MSVLSCSVLLDLVKFCYVASVKLSWVQLSSVTMRLVRLCQFSLVKLHYVLLDCVAVSQLSYVVIQFKNLRNLRKEKQWNL